MHEYRGKNAEEPPDMQAFRYICGRDGIDITKLDCLIGTLGAQPDLGRVAAYFERESDESVELQATYTGQEDFGRDIPGFARTIPAYIEELGRRTGIEFSGIKFDGFFPDTGTVRYAARVDASAENRTHYNYTRFVLDGSLEAMDAEPNLWKAKTLVVFFFGRDRDEK